MTEKNTGYETVENINGAAEGLESAYVEFPSDVLEKLNADLDPDLISEREGAGKRMLKYIEAYVAIDQANRIFGHGAGGRASSKARRCTVFPRQTPPPARSLTRTTTTPPGWASGCTDRCAPATRASARCAP